MTNISSSDGPGCKTIHYTRRELLRSHCFMVSCLIQFVVTKCEISFGSWFSCLPEIGISMSCSACQVELFSHDTELYIRLTGRLPTFRISFLNNNLLTGLSYKKYYSAALLCRARSSRIIASLGRGTSR